MRKKLFVPILMVVGILLLNFTAILAFAQITAPHAADAMWVEPAASNFSTATTSVGFKFNVTVAMNITENVFAYQVAMHYNRTQLKCIRAAVTAPPTSEYMSGHATTSGISIDGGAYGNGSVVVAETCSGSDFIPGPHSGTLFWAEFQIMLAPSESQPTLNSTFDISKEYALTNTYAWDQNANPITFAPYDGSFSIIPELDSSLILVIFLTLTLAAMTLSKKALQKKLK